MLETVYRPGFGGCRELDRRLERARPKARFRRGDSPLRATSRVFGQFRSSLQERRRGGNSTPSLCARGGSLELGGDLLVGTRGGAGTVPGPPVRVMVGIGCFGEGSVHAMAVLGRRRPIRG